MSNIVLKPIKEIFKDEYIASRTTPATPNPPKFIVEQIEIHDDDPYDSGSFDMKTIAPMAIVHIDLFYPSEIYNRLYQGELVEVKLEIVE